MDPAPLSETSTKPKRSKTKKRPKPKKRSAESKTKKAPTGAVARSERLDMRLTKAEKAKINAKAKKTGTTITEVVIAAVAKIR